MWVVFALLKKTQTQTHKTQNKKQKKQTKKRRHKHHLVPLTVPEGL